MSFDENNLILDIYNKLLKSFSYQGWWPIFDVKKNVSVYNPQKYICNKKYFFEVSVGAILTQNTSWKNVEKAIFLLKKNNKLDPQKILKTPDKILYKIIRSSGYFRQKTLKLKEFSKWFIKNRNKIFNISKKDKITDLRNELLSIKGIGMETADSILLYGLGFKIFVIDSYTKRIYLRTSGDSQKYDYEKLRSLFESSLPSDFKIYNELHALLVKLGKEVCKKKNPTCQKCPIMQICKFKKELIK